MVTAWHAPSPQILIPCDIYFFHGSWRVESVAHLLDNWSMDSVSIMCAGYTLMGEAPSDSSLPTAVTTSWNRSHTCNLPQIAWQETTHDTGMFRKMLPWEHHSFSLSRLSIRDIHKPSLYQRPARTHLLFGWNVMTVTKKRSTDLKIWAFFSNVFFLNLKPNDILSRQRLIFT